MRIPLSFAQSVILSHSSSLLSRLLVQNMIYFFANPLFFMQNQSGPVTPTKFPLVPPSTKPSFLFKSLVE